MENFGPLAAGDRVEDLEALGDDLGTDAVTADDGDRVVRVLATRALLRHASSLEIVL